MTALDTTDLVGRTAVDRNGEKVGKIGQIYLDDRSGDPVWVTVSTGLFGNHESFAPLYGATDVDGQLQLAVDKDQVKNAPNIDADGRLVEDETDALYRYYAGSLGPGDGGAGTGGTGTGGTGTDAVRPAGHDTSGPDTDDAMTRSEERLHVGTENVETGRARLRKYVVTEQVTQIVPVSHEEVRIEREPITDADVDAATDGPALSEEEHEVTLHAERPVVDTETVPVERVRLGTETVTEQAQVDEQVRHEEIDTDGVTDVDGTRR